MNRKPEVLRDFVRMRPNDQVPFGIAVIGGLTNNPTVFIPADLLVSIADLTAANELLAEKHLEFKQLGHNFKEAFTVAELAWVQKFNLTADYVELVAREAGTEAGYIIQLSKFHLTKTETDPSELPTQPVADMSISNSQRGTVSVKVKPVKNARAFLYGMITPNIDIEVSGNQITMRAGNDVFASFIITTEREVKFLTLPAIVVTAAVAALNTAGLGEFSTVTEVKIP